MCDFKVFNKNVLTVAQQVDKLKNESLLFKDESWAMSYLGNHNFYRLQGYMHHFQDRRSHKFSSCLYFEDIINVYEFDSELRLLLFEATGKIEISLRNQLINYYSLEHGSHWYLKSHLFRNENNHKNFLQFLSSKMNDSDEAFIKHYKEKYDIPSEPACWMIMELISFGYLSRLFSNLNFSDCKSKIVEYYGLSSYEVLENWLHCITFIRNKCAHHNRLWNKNCSYNIKIPKKTNHSFVQNKNIENNKLYAYICCISYLLNVINPDNCFKKSFIDLFDKYHIQLEGMGFPKDWEDDPFWASSKKIQIPT
ncbi:MAG: Abi family protein [Methanimicrococcus sp.]|nr:Abi family protein [Methanimicrococcus sp.]